MKRTLLLFTMLAFALPAWQTSRGADVSVDFFYNNMSGGSWVEVDDYGYCWQPDVAVSNVSWRPYADGYWAHTEIGWTWISYEDFGWATYHYGRWARLSDYGWVWVPGRDEDLEWGPAWVSWRTGGDHIGWAPLPPRRGGVVFAVGGSISGRVDIDFDIGPAYYNFVSVRHIGEPVLRDRIVDVSQNVTYVNQTVNVTNITYKNKVVHNYGPDIDVINKTSTRPIQRLRLERQENVDVSAAAKSGTLTKVQGDKLVVSAPVRIKKQAQQGAPPTVKTKVTQAKIDRGWSGVGDPNAQTQLKEKMKTEDASKIPPPTGAGAAGQAAGGVSSTNAAAASGAEVEKGKGKRGKPGQLDQTAGAGSSAAAPGEPATAGDQMGQERGKFKAKGKNKGADGDAAAAGTAPTGDTSAATESSSAASVDQERGKGRGKGKRAEFPAGATAPTETTGAAATSEDGTAGGGGGKKGRKQFEGSASQSLGQPGEAGEQGQGKGKGRRMDQLGGAGETQGAAEGGKRKGGRGQTVEPSGAQPGGPGPAVSAEQRKGKGEGKKKKEKDEAVPTDPPQ